MVILNMSMLREIEEEMTSHCLGANVEIVIDCGNKAVYLQWHYWRNTDIVLSRKVHFADIECGRIDVLKYDAKKGSVEFATEVTKLLKEKGL